MISSTVCYRRCDCRGWSTVATPKTTANSTDAAVSLISRPVLRKGEPGDRQRGPSLPCAATRCTWLDRCQRIPARRSLPVGFADYSGRAPDYTPSLTGCCHLPQPTGRRQRSASCSCFRTGRIGR